MTSSGITTSPDRKSVSESLLREPASPSLRRGECSVSSVSPRGSYYNHCYQVTLRHYHYVIGNDVGSQWRRHGGGGKRGNLPPKKPPIRHTVRSMQIRGDFHAGKMGVGLQDLLSRFTCTDATEDVLWSYDYEKRGVVGVVEGVTLVP